MLFNYPLEVAIVAMVIAQTVKLPILFILGKKWDPMIVFSTGGMPSSHSAFVTSLTIAIGLTEGVSSPLFAISFVVAGVIIHDSVGLRREAGRHAIALNEMKDDFGELQTHFSNEVDVDDEEDDLKELLGHEPIEALMGVILGICCALAGYAIFF